MRSALITAAVMIVLYPALAQAGVARTETFRVSVTIPALIGVNDDQEISLVKFDPFREDQEIFMEEVTRGNQTIVLKTIVAK